MLLLSGHPEKKNTIKNAPDLSALLLKISCALPHYLICNPQGEGNVSHDQGRWSEGCHLGNVQEI